MDANASSSSTPASSLPATSLLDKDLGSAALPPGHSLRMLKPSKKFESRSEPKSVGPPAGLLSRLAAFLPQIREANDKLQQQIEEDGADAFDIERVDEENEPYIEMNVAITENAPPSDTDGSDDDDDDGSDDSSDEDGSDSDSNGCANGDDNIGQAQAQSSSGSSGGDNLGASDNGDTKGVVTLQPGGERGSSKRKRAASHNAQGGANSAAAEAAAGASASSASALDRMVDSALQRIDQDAFESLILPGEARETRPGALKRGRKAQLIEEL